MIELDKYISCGEIDIRKDEWIRLNMLYEKEDIMNSIKQYILNGDIRLPLRTLSLEDAKQSFIQLQRHKTNDIQCGLLSTRYDYDFDNIQSGRYIDEPNVGAIASDYFQQENRFQCGSVNSPSPVRTWKSEKFLTGAINALWTLKCDSVNTTTLRQVLSLRKYIASQFKPAVAKSIYEKFNSVDVLDFSAGWGDRLCGFYACQHTRSYIGIDPNTSVYRTYYRQCEMYEEFSHKQTTFYNAPAEDVVLPCECVDTVFTSPPYFNIERYSDEETQSYKRYRKLDDWLNGFLFKSLDTACSALKQNGVLIINISDVYSGHKVNKICDPMNHYLEASGMTYEECLGMKMAKRPNSRAHTAQNNGSVFVEPIWVWRKK